MSLKIISDKFEGADFKYNINFFKVLALKYLNKAFWVVNLRIPFYFTKPTSFALNLHLFFVNVKQIINNNDNNNNNICKVESSGINEIQDLRISTF